MFGFPVCSFIIVALAWTWAGWMFKLLGTNARYQWLRWFYLIACVVCGLAILMAAIYEWWDDQA